MMPGSRCTTSWPTAASPNVPTSREGCFHERDRRPHQQLLGFSALKNAIRLEEEIRAQLTNDIDVEKNANWKLIHDYPFGGFGKTTSALFQFMEEFKTKTNIALDKVYTAKMMFGIADLLSKNTFARGAKILVIHTGGLQGNLLG